MVRARQPTDTISLEGFVANCRAPIERALANSLPLASRPEMSNFNQALRDAVFPGGRRIRPILALLASELVFAGEADALRAAVVVEFLHSSALIFDDLPAMDNALERRGRACLHLRYGEAVAMMVGLALLNSAYGVIALGLANRSSPEVGVFRELTSCIAAQISGQAADLLSGSMQNLDGAAEDPSACHWKTSALVRLSLTLGPMLSGATGSDIATLAHAGQLLGEAYQTLDDCRDIEEDTASFQRGRNATFAMQIGCKPARRLAENLIARAQGELVANFGDVPAASRLCEFANSLCG
jgi:geranylgeranyl pyrophosphate synthase